MRDNENMLNTILYSSSKQKAICLIYTVNDSKTNASGILMTCNFAPKIRRKATKRLKLGAAFIHNNVTNSKADIE